MNACLALSCFSLYVVVLYGLRSNPDYMRQLMNGELRQSAVGIHCTDVLDDL